MRAGTASRATQGETEVLATGTKGRHGRRFLPPGSSERSQPRRWKEVQPTVEPTGAPSRASGCRSPQIFSRRRRQQVFGLVSLGTAPRLPRRFRR